MLSYFNFNKKLLVLSYFFLLLIVGLFIYPDFGISLDEDNTRINGFVTFKYICEIFLPEIIYKIDNIIDVPSLSDWKEQGHGVVFDLPAAFIEFFFEIKDSRNYFLMRHFISFAFFYISIYFFFLLIRDRYNSIYMGLLGSSFLILSPRIFAHSFYNNKDIIFMSIFIISIYTGTKLLRDYNLKNTILFAFASALAIDTRILGIITPTIFFTISFLKIFPFEKKNIKYLNFNLLLLVLLSFFIYVFWPYLWENPIKNFLYVFEILSNFNENVFNFYLGEQIFAQNIPWHYPIVWILITTPITYVLLFVSGFFLITYRLIKRIINISEININNDIWRGKNEMVDLFIYATFLGPLFLVILLNSTLYDGWRHLYFIYPSFLYISLYGTNFIVKNILKKIKKPFFILILLSMIPTVLFIYKNHPYQYTYFNLAAGKDYNTNFDMDYWGVSNKDALKFIAENNKNNVKVGNIGTTDLSISKKMLKKKNRDKIIIVYNVDEADYIINNFRDWKGNYKPTDFIIPKGFNIINKIKVEGVTINSTYYRKN